MEALPGFLASLAAFFLSSLGGGASPSGEALERLLEPARRGDKQAREELLRRYQPLVLRVGAQVSGRYLRVGQDEEVSVGLLALNEAVDRYDPARGAGFVSFAEMVVRRRLIDYYRRQKGRPEVPLSELQGEDEEGNPVAGVEERAAMARYSAEEEARDRRDEILRFSRRLLEFGIKFSDLVADCPKHEDARQRAIECARVVATTPALREHLLARKELPLKQLETRVQVSRKTLERQRRYIIAIVLILTEEFDHLRHYLSGAVAPR